MTTAPREGAEGRCGGRGELSQHRSCLAPRLPPGNGLHAVCDRCSRHSLSGADVSSIHQCLCIRASSAGSLAASGGGRAGSIVVHPAIRPVARAVHRRTWLLAALAMLVAASAGHFLLLSGYDLSRDEQMASFDAAVFGQGYLVAPLPPFWRDAFGRTQYDVSLSQPGLAERGFPRTFPSTRRCVPVFWPHASGAPWLVWPAGVDGGSGCKQRCLAVSNALGPVTARPGFVAPVRYAAPVRRKCCLQGRLSRLCRDARPSGAQSVLVVALFPRRTTVIGTLPRWRVGFFATGLHTTLDAPDVRSTIRAVAACRTAPGAAPAALST